MGIWLVWPFIQTFRNVFLIEKMKISLIPITLIADIENLNNMCLFQLIWTDLGRLRSGSSVTTEAV